MAEPTYYLRLKDQTGAQVAIFSGAGRGETGGGLQSFTYRKRLRTPGSHTVRIFGDDDRIPLLDLDEADTLDSQFEFYRRDPQGGLDWYKDFETFHRGMDTNSGAEGRLTFTSYGVGYNTLLLAETILWPAGSAEAKKTGAAETVAKEFVDENIGPSALAASGRFRDGNLSGVTIEADAGTGNTWSGGRTFKNLIDVLVELAEIGPGDYWMIGNGDAAFEFQWRDTRWGDDKTQGNAAGNPPVVFSENNQNATNISYNYQRQNEINTCDVLGGGQGANRQHVSRTSGGESDSPWARRAIARDARDEVDTTILQTRGDEVVDKNRPRRLITFDAMQTTSTRYGRDWDVGDLVTVIAPITAAIIDVKIIGVTVTMDSGGNESITVETEEE
jgi:hypothetical protein